MNADRLLALYDRVAEAPDAVARLRRFVLDLAVRGKLVEQNPLDEPAAVLLRRITKEKERLVVAGKFKTLASDRRIGDTTLSFPIPANWTWCFLDDLAAIARGGSPRPIKSYLTDDPNGMPWIKIGDSDRGSIYINDTEERIRPEGVTKSRVVFPGDLLLSNSMSFGYPYITNVEGCIHDGWLVIRTPESLLDKLYLHCVFLSGHAKQAFSEAASGAVVQNLNAEKARLLSVPLPPLAEQHRIVEKVDELIALCGQLEEARAAREVTRDQLSVASLSRLSASNVDDGAFRSHVRFAVDALPALTARTDQVTHLRQTILDLAVRGKLVEPDTAADAVEISLRAIQSRRDTLVKSGTLRRPKPTRPIAKGDAPFRIPAGWSWVRVGEIALSFMYGTSSKATRSDKGVPVLTMGNIQDGSIVRTTEKTIPETSSELPALFLKKHDLLYNRTNSTELVGKTGIYLGDDNCLAFASYLIRIRLSLEHTEPRYINFVMNAPYFRETQIVPHIKKQTGQANVSGSILCNMLIPLPSLAEQRRIVARVDELIAYCDGLESALNAANGTRSNLLQAILGDFLASVDDGCRDA